jgi:hypothetical protein
MKNGMMECWLLVASMWKNCILQQFLSANLGETEHQHQPQLRCIRMMQVFCRLRICEVQQLPHLFVIPDESMNQ